MSLVKADIITFQMWSTYLGTTQKTNVSTKQQSFWALTMNQVAKRPKR